MEIWDIYNKDREKTGRTAARGDTLEPGEYHLVIHVCIFDSRGRLLIQKRQPFKKGWSGMWDVSVGGAALAGESSSQAAERELLEELGYSTDLSCKRPFFTVHFKKGFDDYFFIRDDADISGLTLQYEEVHSVKWADREEIMHMLDEGIFIPYHRSLIELMFDIVSHPGSHSE